MIKSIIAGRVNPDLLAEKAQTALRGKIPELRLALRGRITQHHRLMLRELMEDLEFVEAKIERLEKAIAPLVDLDKVARLCTIPGIDPARHRRSRLHLHRQDQRPIHVLREFVAEKSPDWVSRRVGGFWRRIQLPGLTQLDVDVAGRFRLFGTR